MKRSSPLRILAVTNMYPTVEDPAFGSFVASQMRSLESAGVSVTVDFLNGRQSNWEYLRAIHRIRQQAGRGGFDVVHAHYGLTGFIAAFQSLPLVVSFCGDDLLGTPDGSGGRTVKSRLAVHLSRIAARRADAIICKSEQLRDALPPKIDRSRVHVIGNGVDTTRFCPGDQAAARKRLGVGAHATERLIIFPHSRRQAAVKRFDLAEGAVSALCALGVRARLWVVNGVAPEAMADYYRAADCFLLTSDHEGSPNTVKEALCCNLPVVSVDVGDVRRWLTLTPGCRLVARDPSDIARGLSEVLGWGGRVDGSRVRAEIASSVVAKQVLNVYSEAIARRSRSDGT